jgi:hypothetical protein
VTDIYRIHVRGQLDPARSTWFDGLEVQPQANGETVLSGPIVDQAALHGVLMRIRDLGLLLLSLTRAGADGREGPAPAAEGRAVDIQAPRPPETADRPRALTLPHSRCAVGRGEGTNSVVHHVGVLG